MTWARVFLVIPIFLICSSCGEKEESPLEISVSPSFAYIVPGTSDYNDCYDTDIEEPRFSFNKLKIKWKGPGNFYPALIRIRVNAGRYLTSEFVTSITEGDSDLTYFLTGNPTQGYIEPSETAEYESVCPIAGGGLPISATVRNSNDFRLSATVEVVGSALGDNDIEKPVSASTRVQIINE